MVCQRTDLHFVLFPEVVYLLQQLTLSRPDVSPGFLPVSSKSSLWAVLAHETL